MPAHAEALHYHLKFHKQKLKKNQRHTTLSQFCVLSQSLSIGYHTKNILFCHCLNDIQYKQNHKETSIQQVWV